MWAHFGLTECHEARSLSALLECVRGILGEGQYWAANAKRGKEEGRKVEAKS